MKTRLFLSVPIDDRRVNNLLHVLEQSARVASSFRLVTNVYPMYSSVHGAETGENTVESGARIDILSDVEPDMVLLLWERLRQVLGVHCVWIDYRQTPPNHIGDDYEYSGCVCEWAHYKAHHDHIGHERVLTCSEYAAPPNSAFGRDAKPAPMQCTCPRCNMTFEP